jgi:aspartate kinase
MSDLKDAAAILKKGSPSMTCIVQKYGGSSLADVDKIMNVAEMIARVKQQGVDVAVVVSAMGKTTNQLVDMARSIAPK